MSEELFSGVSAGDTSDGASGQDAPAGHYPQLRLVKCKIDASKKNGNRYFKALLEVLVPANGLAEGSQVEFYAQLEGNSHASYNKDARARVMCFVGSMFGLKTVEEINKHVTGQLLTVVTNRDLQPETGKVVSANVAYKPGMTKFPKWDFQPVLDASGQPLVVRGAAAKNLAVSAPISTTPVAAPVVTAQPVPAPVAPAAPTVPAGWAVHPADARFIYNTSVPTEMKQIG